MLCVDVKDRVESLQPFLHGLVYDPCFEDESLHDFYLGDMPEVASYNKKREKLRKSDKSKFGDFVYCGYQEPLLTAEQEYHLFRKYNFLRWKASTLLEDYGVTDDMVDEAKELIDQAESIRHQIMLCNVRLVIKFSMNRYRTDRNSSNDNSDESLKPSGFFVVEDTISENLMVVGRCVKLFKWNSGLKFSTYAGRAIIFKIRDLIAYDKQRIETVNLTSDEDKEFLDILISDTSVDDQSSELNDTLLFLLSELSVRERSILKKRFVEGLKFDEISQDEKVSPQRIQQIVSESFKKIRNRFSRDEWENLEKSIFEKV